MKKRIWSILLFFCLMFLGDRLILGQAAKTTYTETELTDLLEKALGRLRSGDFAIYFEGISYGLKQPLDIFTAPVYKVYRGGYYFNSGDKLEMNLGGMKALSDGQVTVLIDVINKQIMIDSVHQIPLSSDDPKKEQELFEKAMGIKIGEGVALQFLGRQKIKGKSCLVVSGSIKGTPGQQSLYYITEKDNQLLMMAEKQKLGYDVYWLDRISASPPKHSYAVNVPKKELQKLGGYEVTDMRFVRDDLSKKGK
jgi:hypothetical protein